MKSCCEDTTKRSPAEQLNDEVSFTRCTECGCRHFEIVAEPGSLNLIGADL